MKYFFADGSSLHLKPIGGALISDCLEEALEISRSAKQPVTFEHNGGRVTVDAIRMETLYLDRMYGEWHDDRERRK